MCGRSKLGKAINGCPPCSTRLGMMVVTKHLNRHRVVRSMLFLCDALVSPQGEHAWLYGLRCLSPKCVPRGYLLVERKQARPGVDRRASRRLLQGQQQRLAWMSSCWSRDFTRGMLARCRWYHRVAKVCSSAYGTRCISSVTKVCSSAYGARRISSVTKVCSSAYGARCISSGVVMPRAWARYSLVFYKTSCIAMRLLLQWNRRHALPNEIHCR